MASLFGTKTVELLRRSGTCVSASEALANKKYVLLYFSAHWCPPCRVFTKALKDFYEQHSAEHSFEVLFVSRDNSAEEMLAYFQHAHGDWLALSYRDAQTIGESMAQQFGLYAIPSLLVLENAGHGCPVVTSYGREMVLRDAAAQQFPWSNADATIIAERRLFMWKAAFFVVLGIIAVFVLSA